MSKFKCPVTNNLYTQALFWECKFDKERALYTLKDEDYTIEENGRVLPSLKRLYLECGDPTEYEFATTYFYSWNHWKRCVANKLITEHVQQWREELEIKLMSEGIRNVVSHAYGEKGYQAAKWLAEKGWIDKRVGRPTNEQIAGELRQAAKIKDQFEDDFNRVSDYIQ